MNQTRSVAIVYLALVFTSGVAVGGISMWLYSSRSVSAGVISRPSPEEYRRRYVDEMNSRLKLRADQLARLNTILDQARDLYKQVYDKHKPEYKAIQEHQVDQITAMLDESQRVEYAKIRAEREARARSKQLKMPY